MRGFVQIHLDALGQSFPADKLRQNMGCINTQALTKLY